MTPLTEKQLTHVMDDAERDLARARSVRDQLRLLGSRIAAQTVPLGLTDGLPNGSRQFVSDWNGYLGDAARAVSDFRDVTGRILGFIADFGTLANAAKVLKAGGSPTAYESALQRVKLGLRRINELQAVAARPLAYSTSMAAIMKLTQSDPDAHAIFQWVAVQYPSGVISPSGYLFTPRAINT